MIAKRKKISKYTPRDFSKKKDVEEVLPQVEAMINAGKEVGWKTPSDLSQLIKYKKELKEKLEVLKK